MNRQSILFRLVVLSFALCGVFGCRAGALSHEGLVATASPFEAVADRVARGTELVATETTGLPTSQLATAGSLGAAHGTTPQDAVPADIEARDPHGAQAMPAPMAPAPSCGPADSERDFYGFYRDDAWERGRVVLTFDDGPHPTATPRVLDLLEAYRMKGAFFVVGRAINRDTYPLVQRIARDGHILATHSYSHDVHMTRTSAPERSVDVIVAQHASTIMLIDLALMATSPEDFDAMFMEVFESNPAAWLTTTQLVDGIDGYRARHRALLAARGYEGDARPHPVLYSRPPGGGPFVEQDGALGSRIYSQAMEQLGLVNVLWHGASGDTHPEHRSELGYLTGNMRDTAEAGGVLLIHDYMRADALRTALDTIASDPEVSVMTLDEAVEHKYGCDAERLASTLKSR